MPDFKPPALQPAAARVFYCANQRGRYSTTLVAAGAGFVFGSCAGIASWFARLDQTAAVESNSG